MYGIRPVDDRLGIKDHNIGGLSGFQDAPIRHANSFGGQAGHFIDSLFEGEHLFLPHV